MTWEDFTELCPTLVNDGFSNEQFNIVMANWERGLSLGTIKGDWADFARSFVMGEWGANHLEETGWISAVAVIFERMKTGPMFKPKGYVDPSIQAMKDRLKELEEEKQLQSNLSLNFHESGGAPYPVMSNERIAKESAIPTRVLWCARATCGIK